MASLDSQVVGECKSWNTGNQSPSSARSRPETRNTVFFNINGLVDSGCAHTKQKDKEELNCLQSVKHPCRSTKTTQPS